MITKMLLEIFQALIDDPAIKRLLGNYDFTRKSDLDLEQLMDDLDLNAEEREKFKAAYQEYQSDPYQSYDRYTYKYEPKSDSPFDKFDAYYQKFEDQARQTEEKYGKGTGDYRHRQYQKYRTGASSSSDPTSPFSDEEKKHFTTLGLPIGATFDEIKAAYRDLMKKYHPDRFQDASQKKNAEERSMKINDAYDYFKKKFRKD